MIIMTGFAASEVPFQTVFLHGLVRDKDGKKMSKTTGNVINPLQMIEKYGTDALRLSLLMGTTSGSDLKIIEEKIKARRNFVNKLWNISRFILSQDASAKGGSASGGKSQISNAIPEGTSLSDQWILEELEKLVGE